MHPVPTPKEWFVEASRCYLENHQGCAWCGGSHRVFRLRQGSKLVFYCNFCDFRVSHNPETDQYDTVPGENQATVGSKTLLEF